MISNGMLTGRCIYCDSWRLSNVSVWVRRALRQILPIKSASQQAGHLLVVKRKRTILQRRRGTRAINSIQGTRWLSFFPSLRNSISLRWRFSRTGL